MVKPFEVFQGGVRHLCIIEVQILEVLEPFQVMEPSAVTFVP